MASEEWIPTDPCPSCGSGAVDVIMYGLVMPSEPFDSPAPNVRLAGCVVRDVNRACRDCDHEWRATGA